MREFCGEITSRLHELGYRIGDVTVRLWHDYGIDISHNQVKIYCRSPNRNSGDPKVWSAIDNIMSELEGKENE